ncbi:MAG: glycosyltransferase [Phycisphaeraceae bacterium]|nr:glycosyltransferase [Phycisphaeraceae bacterium]
MSLVSVIMPMKNARDFVADALRSVLAETGVTLQVIVVDDGSEDGCGRVVRDVTDPRVILIEGPRQGIAAAFNAGLSVAGGDIIMRCDADDRFAAGRIAWQTAWLAEHPDDVAVCGYFTTVDDDGQPLAQFDKRREAGLINDDLRQGHTLTHLCAYAIRTQTLRRMGGLRSWFVTAEDIDLQLRLADAGRVWYEPRPAYEYRLHDASITHQQRDPLRLFYEQSARRFAAQRQSGERDDLELGKPPHPPRGKGGSATDAAQQAQQLLLGQAWRQHEEGQRGSALRSAWRACLKRPSSLAAWRSLAMMCLRKPVTK